MYDDSEETVIDDIGNDAFARKYAKEHSDKQVKGDINKDTRLDAPANSHDGNTMVLPPRDSKPKPAMKDKNAGNPARAPFAAPAAKPGTHNGKKSKGALIGAATGVAVVIAGVAAVMIYNAGKNAGEESLTAEKQAVTETAAAVPSQSAKNLFDSSVSDLNKDAVKASGAMAVIKTLATDSAYTPAMLEYGILLARPTSAFPELTAMQAKLDITPDLDASTAILTKVLLGNPDNYKAAYWIYNNLMTKFDRNNISGDETKLLVSAFNSFKTAVSASGDNDAAKYKNAMIKSGDEDTLRAWALIN